MRATGASTKVAPRLANGQLAMADAERLATARRPKTARGEAHAPSAARQQHASRPTASALVEVIEVEARDA